MAFLLCPGFFQGGKLFDPRISELWPGRFPRKLQLEALRDFNYPKLYVPWPQLLWFFFCCSPLQLQSPTKFGFQDFFFADCSHFDVEELKCSVCFPPQALICGELDILKDWCYEAVSSAPKIEKMKNLGLPLGIGLIVWGWNSGGAEIRAFPALFFFYLNPHFLQSSALKSKRILLFCPGAEFLQVNSLCCSRHQRAGRASLIFPI